MDLVVQLIKSLAWPIVVIWLGYLFRGEIRDLFGRVSQLKYKDLEAKFERGLASAEAEAEQALEGTKQRQLTHKEPIYPSPYDQRYAQLLRISEESPRAALLEAWIEVETALIEAAARYDVDVNRRAPPFKLAISLINTGNYAKTVLPLFEDLRVLRNEAAHARDFQPTNRQTRRYLQLAIELALTFRNPL